MALPMFLIWQMDENKRDAQEFHFLEDLPSSTSELPRDTEYTVTKRKHFSMGYKDGTDAEINEKEIQAVFDESFQQALHDSIKLGKTCAMNFLQKNAMK
eukprot:snap_masked-scaffold_10-processed-gene-9.12-mRNA-1 protein AED:1.00 eAED:1.00 QI:0/-1/0/0/-1/1/1/0/98